MKHFRPLEDTLWQHGNTGKRTIQRTCAAFNCEGSTKEGKPFCKIHVESMPYVQSMRRAVAEHLAKENKRRYRDMNPICCACEKEMNCEQNDVFVQLIPSSDSYRSGNRYRCPDCLRAIVTGISKRYRRADKPPPSMLQKVTP